MTRKRLTIEEIQNLKFDDCRACTRVLTRACNGCDAGENFEDADEPEAVDVEFRRWG